MLGRACYNPASYCLSYNCLKLLNDGAVTIFASGLFQSFMTLTEGMSPYISQYLCIVRATSTLIFRYGHMGKGVHAPIL